MSLSYSIILTSQNGKHKVKYIQNFVGKNYTIIQLKNALVSDKTIKI